MKKLRYILCALLALLLAAGCAAPAPAPGLTPAPKPASTESPSLVGRTLIDETARWRYLCDGSDPSPGSTNWAQPGFEDAAWQSARGAFGSKDGTKAPMGDFIPQTLLPMQDEEGAHIPAYFFRTSFFVEDPAAVPALEGVFAYDDAVILYLNGERVFEGNLPEEGFTDNLSYGAQAAQDAPRTGSFRVAAQLKTGENVLAAEVHQAAESSSDVFFGLTSLTVIENSGTLPIEGLCLFTEGDASLTARWLGDGQAMTLRYAPAGDIAYPSTALKVPSTSVAAQEEARYSARLNNLLPDTAYTYWIEADGRRSSAYTFTTAGKEGFSFLLLGDPQITGNTSAAALAKVVKAYANEDFVLCAGDLADSSSKVEQYRLFLDAEGFASLPLAAIIGNHEGPELYDLYFAPENLPKSGRDFRFSYQDTLFVCLDSNQDASAHEAFLAQCIRSGDWRWVIVCMHHSLFGLGKHADDASTAVLQQSYAALFAAYDVDLVLSGHDHLYARTRLMENLAPASAGGMGGTLTKSSGQTLYVCAGSSTGSKYYERVETDERPFAVIGEEERATATRIEVGKESIRILTRYTDGDEIADEVILTRAIAREEAANAKDTLIPQPAAVRSGREALVKRELAWLLSTQLPNGALAQYPAQEGENAVNPYFADYAAMALLQGGETEAVNRYLDWRFSHLNTSDFDVNGLPYTIYDYTVSVENGQVTAEKATMSYDSTDSYAATFLLLLRDYYARTGDAAYIQSHYLHIAGVAQILLSTAENGLTLARPDYPVQYLMDNCEVLLSLSAVNSLLTQAVLPSLTKADAENCAALQKNIRVLQDQMRLGLEQRMWTSAEGRYAFAVQPDGAVSSFDPDVFYPDGVAQLTPLIYGLLSPASARARALYDDFCARWDWAALSLIETEDTTHYWGMCAYCAAVMGDDASLDAYLDAYASEVATDHAYPLFNADAAWVVLACFYAPGD